MQRCRVVAVLGTRPEAIKLALVIRELRKRADEFQTAVVHTGQHRTMLDSAHANCYVTKPVDLDEFLRAVQSIESFWLTLIKLPSR